MKTQFIVKGMRSEIRVADNFVKDYYSHYMHATSEDFGLVKFNSKTEEKAAFAGIAEHKGEGKADFYEDKETGVTYIRVAHDMGNIDGYKYLASFFNYTGHYDLQRY